MFPPIEPFASGDLDWTAANAFNRESLARDPPTGTLVESDSALARVAPQRLGDIVARCRDADECGALERAIVSRVRLEISAESR